MLRRALILTVMLCGSLSGVSARATVVKGCTAFAANGRCRGLWFQVGPGADGFGGTYIRELTWCATPARSVCDSTQNTGPIIGRYVDDTTPCPSTLRGTPRTHDDASLQESWGRRCVQYWVTDEYVHNPDHGLIYAAIGDGGHVDGGYRTRFKHATKTLLEWYPHLDSSGSVGHPPAGEQGYILQRYFAHPAGRAPTRTAFLKSWKWCAITCRGVVAYF